jgi:hypothetical protein
MYCCWYCCCCAQDVTLLAEIPESAWEPEAGKASLSKVLGVQDLDASPLNMSLVAPNKVLLRGYFLNNSNITNGVDGMESFQDVVLWCVTAAAAAGGDTRVAADCAALACLLFLDSCSNLHCLARSLSATTFPGPNMTFPCFCLCVFLLC